jgi:site-specific recombinase XerD
MKVYPKLWTYEPHEDGQCAVKIYVNNGKPRYIGLDISVFQKDWDDKTKRVKKGHPLADIYNSQISTKCIEVERRLREGETFEAIQGRKSGSILELIGVYREEIRKGLHSIRPGTEKNYQASQTRLRQYCAHIGLSDLTFDQIDQKFYNDFWTYLHTTHGIAKQGFSKHVKNLKKFMNLGLERKLHSNFAHKGKEFKMDKKSKGNKVYLTKSEMAQLEQFDLSSFPSLELERDRFLLNYYLILRFDDGIRIDKSGVIESQGKSFYSYTSGKTNVEVTIPLKPAATAILQKYNYQLPSITNQQSNKMLKQLTSMAGLNNIAIQDGKKGPKCAFVSTHTARRSAATNLYLDGISLKIIAQLGGWTQLETLKHYLLASGVEVAMAANEYDFFK